MNIHAKTRQTEKLSIQKELGSVSPVAEDLHYDPMGESYARQWSQWFDNLGEQAAEINSLQTQSLFPSHPINAADEVKKFADFNGIHRVFSLSYQAANNIHFDPISFSLLSSSSPYQLTKRWVKCLNLQKQNRLIASGLTNTSSAKTGPDEAFIETITPNEVVIRPYVSALACKREYGPAVLGGVACALFDLEYAEILVQFTNGRTEPIIFKAIQHHRHFNYDPDVTLIIRGKPKLLLKEWDRTQSSDLSHILKNKELLTHLSQLPKPRDGGHFTMREAARMIGLSTRSLSRKLSSAETGYAEIIRHIRFKNACHDLINDHCTLDDIAFYNGYSDRHHFSREFKRLGGFTPAKFRNILHTSHSPI